MSGARISPRAVINLIKDNLRDRYDSGFPVLKEIIQNADDAKASRLVMGWCNGVEASDNPLLEDPALFFINDAPLLEEHANGIMAVADSSKSSSSDSVGKFGLGMKSLFHLCEAFFFMSSSWQSDDWAADVFNPRDHLKPEWDSFSKSDKQKVENKLQSVLKPASGFVDNCWFVVWVPLRTRERSPEKRAITPSYYPAEALPDFLLEQDLTEKIANIFPLLKRLESVNLLIEENGEFKQWFGIELKSGSERSQFVGQPEFSGGTSLSKWHGNVEILFSESKKTLNYAGVESLLDIESLNALKSVDQGWPTSWQQTSEDDDDETVPEKAEQHVAVVISRMPANEGKAVVTASWAVFLPLSGTQEFKTVNISGEYSYHIHLHGYFFVDAGRKGIHGHDLIGTNPDFPGVLDEKLLRQAWNLTLANQGTLTQLLPALQEFTSGFRASKGDVNRYNGGIQAVFPSKYLSCSTALNSWIYRLTSDGRGWTLVGTEQPVRLLPRPDNKDYQRIWDTFPWVLEQADSICFAQSDKNNIISKQDSVWTAEELEDLLCIDVVGVFSSQANLGYLNSLLELVTNNQNNLSDMQDMLALLAEDALKKIPLTELSKQTALFKKFIGYIYSGRRLSLPFGRTHQTLWDAINSLSTDVFIVPDFLDSEHEASAPISLEDAVTILTALDKLLRLDETSIGTDESAEKVIHSLLSRLRESSRESSKELYRRCGDLRLFCAYDLKSNKVVLKSRNELTQLYGQSRLFMLKGPKNIPNSFGLGRELSDVTKDEILYVTREVKDLLFDHRLDDCNPESVLTCLSKYPLLAAESMRLGLLHKLTSASLEKSESIRGFRYLLHGSCNDTGHVPLWKITTHADSVWLKLWKEYETTERPEWSILSPILSGELSDRNKRDLNIDDISPERILSDFGESIINIDFTALHLTKSEREEILLRVDQRDLWRKLPIHLTVDGSLTSIDDNCFLEGTQNLPESFEVTEIVRISDSDGYRRQKEFIGELDAGKLIKAALQQAQPQDYEELILQQLIHLYETSEQPSSDTKQALANPKTPWLSLESGKPVSLAYLLNIDHEQWPEASDLCQNEATECYGLDQIRAELLANRQYCEVLKRYVKRPEDGYRLLIVEAAKLPGYALGDIDSLNSNAIDQLQQITVPSELPGWGLVCELQNNLTHDFCIEDIKPLCKANSTSLLTLLLNQLSSLPSERVVAIRQVLLEAVCRSEHAVSALEKVLLRTQANSYREASSLTYGGKGISSSYLLHKDDWNTIKDKLRMDSNHKISAKPDRYPNRAAALRAYFKTWGHVQPDAVGTFMRLMSNGNAQVKQLTESYLTRYDYDEIFEKFEEAIKLAGGKPASGVIDIQPVICEINKQQVLSIFGKPIVVELCRNFEHILFFPPKGLFGTQPIQLRQVNTNDYSKAQLLNLLQVSTEQILNMVAGVSSVNLSSIWGKIAQSNQFDVERAKRRILENVIYTLERLKIKQDPIGGLIKQYHKYEFLDLESPNNAAKLNGAKTKIQRCLEDNRKVQNLILEGVRRDIEQFEYYPDSVPFELFQNADDAFQQRVELGPKEAEMYPRKFIVRQESEALSFYHWGREINYCPPGIGEKRNSYNRDLIYMVTLNVSDKGESTTGQFGLGFKSCLLISDAPEIISGDIAVKIAGGIIPVVIKKATDLEPLSARVQDVSVDRLRPTLIRLPLRENVSTPNALKRFNESVGLLCVLSRQIRSIEIDGEIVHWAPRKSQRIEGLSFGKAMLPLKEGGRKGKSIIHYKTPDGQFIFQVGSRGLESLAERNMPNFWVTTPIQEDLSAGFIVEAKFQVDNGRCQLSKSNEKNIGVMSVLGRELAQLLTEIFKWTSEDWRGFSQEWALNESLTQQDFWARVWDVLTTGWINSSDDKSVLFQTLFTTQGGLLSFYTRTPALPNRLGEKHHSLVKLSQITCHADQLLTTVFDDLSELQALKKIDANQALIEYEVGGKLEKIGYSIPQKITLTGVLKEEVGDNNQVTPKSAATLGRLFNGSFRDKLSKAPTAECQKLESALESYRFVSETGRNWQAASEMVAFKTEGKGEERNEESLIFVFAPLTVRFSADYDDVGKAFFKQCRGRFHINTSVLHDWVRDIAQQDTGRQNAVMKYLISDFYDSRRLAENIKHSVQPAWMQNINEAALKQAYKWTSDKDIDKYMRLMKDSDSDISNRVKAGISSSSTTMSTAKALEKVYDWWIREQEKQLAEYDQKVYARPLLWSLMEEDDELDLGETRRAWLKLMYLGACQTMGMATEVHHRNAIQWLEEKGWWDTIADSPSVPASNWTYLIDSYLQDAHVNEMYRTWVQILPLYRFSSNLENYVHFFMSTEHLSHLDDLLKSGSSALWQGSGISAPELKATLGIGANFIIRELIRHKVVPATATTRQHAFSLSGRVRRVFSKMGIHVKDQADPYQSKLVFEQLQHHLGDEVRATFNDSFDIPFRILADNPSLMHKLLEIGYIDFGDEQE